jgi:hypothetical protein
VCFHAQSDCCLDFAHTKIANYMVVPLIIPLLLCSILYFIFIFLEIFIYWQNVVYYMKTNDLLFFGAVALGGYFLYKKTAAAATDFGAGVGTAIGQLPQAVFSAAAAPALLPLQVAKGAAETLLGAVSGAFPTGQTTGLPLPTPARVLLDTVKSTFTGIPPPAQQQAQRAITPTVVQTAAAVPIFSGATVQWQGVGQVAKVSTPIISQPVYSAPVFPVAAQTPIQQLSAWGASLGLPTAPAQVSAPVATTATSTSTLTNRQAAISNLQRQGYSFAAAVSKVDTSTAAQIRQIAGR